MTIVLWSREEKEEEKGEKKEEGKVVEEDNVWCDREGKGAQGEQTEHDWLAAAHNFWHVSNKEGKPRNRTFIICFPKSSF